MGMLQIACDIKHGECALIFKPSTLTTPLLGMNILPLTQNVLYDFYHFCMPTKIDHQSGWYSMRIDYELNNAFKIRIDWLDWLGIYFRLSRLCCSSMSFFNHDLHALLGNFSFVCFDDIRYTMSCR